ncbi:hypothetical protein [Luteibaculum oceani]|uniref:DUF4625 domain-containing protein n=1 Tax=Luteibaculum oceani TaxID=1294296 RepID=A0A5C6V9C9_9FLAO|nr:hypothetical protein [Luteibaculum oceani]TXC82073.1 hypothetical protein FRX97_02980 [Luteibaculum oceani]
MKRILALTLLIATLVACEKHDGIRPRFESATVNGTGNIAYVRLGDEFRVDFSAVDNGDLNRVFVRSVKGLKNEKNITRTNFDLAYENNFSLEGSNGTGSASVNAAGAANGTYRFVFDVFDKNGNQGISRVVNVIYQDTARNSRPFWNVNSVNPDFQPGTITINVNRGNEIEVDAVVNSNTDLERIKIEFIGRDHNIFSFEKELPGSADFTFSIVDDLLDENGELIPLLVPVTAAGGDTPLLFSAVDANGNTGVFYINVNVLF